MTHVFLDTLVNYKDYFPHPPEGKYYLVDSGYLNRKGYLAPYKGQRYYVPKFQQGREPIGLKEVFNHAHSSLRNVIERSFGVLKMKWHILLNLPSYPIDKEKGITIACMALHNFIRDSALRDADFDGLESVEDYVDGNMSTQGSSEDGVLVEGCADMGAIRDAIATILIAQG